MLHSCVTADSAAVRRGKLVTGFHCRGEDTHVPFPSLLVWHGAHAAVPSRIWGAGGGAARAGRPKRCSPPQQPAHRQGAHCCAMGPTVTPTLKREVGSFG